MRSTACRVRKTDLCIALAIFIAVPCVRVKLLLTEKAGLRLSVYFCRSRLGKDEGSIVTGLVVMYRFAPQWC